MKYGITHRTLYEYSDPVTVSADPKAKVYGTADPSLTYKITNGTLAFTDAFAGALDRSPGENVGAYTINQGTLVLSNTANNILAALVALPTVGSGNVTVLGAGGPATFTFTVTFKLLMVAPPSVGAVGVLASV